VLGRLSKLRNLGGLVGLDEMRMQCDTETPVRSFARPGAEFFDPLDPYCEYDATAKFRSMVESAAENRVQFSEEDRGGLDPRVMGAGHLIRPTYLDEIPQLLSILLAHIGVVGPRPERPELDGEIMSGPAEWRNRWPVKPSGRVGRDSRGAGHDPRAKLRYDVEDIWRLRFWVELKIGIRHMWLVIVDIADRLRNVD
jgi:lipopolysaccharide/colanic/teichoic acid biosynthesis glycosyltransferase